VAGPLGVSMADIGTLRQTRTSKEQYLALDAKRRLWFSQKSVGRQNDVKAALTKHTQTEEYQACLLNPSGNAVRIQEHLTIIASVKARRGTARTGVAQNYHIVFILDESGSMSTHWPMLVQAFQNFLDVRLQLNTADVVSVVLFDDGARPLMTGQTLAAAKSKGLPELKGGYTNFKPALNMAKQAIGQAKSNPNMSSLPVMGVFMSDGENCDGDVTAEMKALHNAAPLANLFQFHSVFFTSGAANSTQLQAMANSVPGGAYVLASSAEMLEDVFLEIAEDESIMHS